MKNIPVMVKMNNQMHQEIVHIAETRGEAKSSVVREAIREYLESRKQSVEEYKKLEERND